MLNIAIIDYGAGNLQSVLRSFEYILKVHHKRGKVTVISDGAEINDNITHIVLPGVGSFADCAFGLKQMPNMVSNMEHHVFSRKLPFLGICVGMQLLMQKGFEGNQQTEGLSWFEGEVNKIVPNNKEFKVPHMGWNELLVADYAPDFVKKMHNKDLYYANSYVAYVKNDEDCLAHFDYGGKFCAMIAKDNIIASQFHPEKSQEVGLQFLADFCNL